MIKLIVGGVISGEFSNGDNYFQVMCVCVGWDKDRDGENVCVYVCVCGPEQGQQQRDR